MRRSSQIVKWGEVELQVVCHFSEDGSLAALGGVFLPAPRDPENVFSPKVCAATAAMLEAVTVIQRALIPDPEGTPLDLEGMRMALDSVRGACALKELCRVLHAAEALARLDADALATRRLARIPVETPREELA